MTLPSLPSQQPCPSTWPKGPSRTPSQKCLHFHESCKGKAKLGGEVPVLGYTLESPGELPKQHRYFSLLSEVLSEGLGWDLGINIFSFSGCMCNQG